MKSVVICSNEWLFVEVTDYSCFTRWCWRWWWRYSPKDLCRCRNANYLLTPFEIWRAIDRTNAVYAVATANNDITLGIAGCWSFILVCERFENSSSRLESLLSISVRIFWGRQRPTFQNESEGSNYRSSISSISTTTTSSSSSNNNTKTAKTLTSSLTAIALGYQPRK